MGPNFASLPYLLSLTNLSLSVSRGSCWWQTRSYFLHKWWITRKLKEGEELLSLTCEGKSYRGPHYFAFASFRKSAIHRLKELLCWWVILPCTGGSLSLSKWNTSVLLCIMWASGNSGISQWRGCRVVVQKSGPIHQVSSFPVVKFLLLNWNFRVAGDVVAGVVTKCLNARPKTKEKGIDIILMYIEVEKQDVVQVSGEINKMVNMPTCLWEFAVKLLESINLYFDVLFPVLC